MGRSMVHKSDLQRTRLLIEQHASELYDLQAKVRAALEDEDYGHALHRLERMQAACSSVMAEIAELMVSLKTLEPDPYRGDVW